jgi:hypothetical protein
MGYVEAGNGSLPNTDMLGLHISLLRWDKFLSLASMSWTKFQHFSQADKQG